MNNLFQKLMLGGSSAALFAISSYGAAFAQDQASPDIEQVVVSASRISIAGYTAPTPVTVVSAASLTRDAKIDIGDFVRELPAVGASDAPDNGSHAGDAARRATPLSPTSICATSASFAPWCCLTASASWRPTRSAAVLTFPLFQPH